MLPPLPLLLLPLPLPSGDAHVPVLPTVLVCVFLHRHTSEAAATCDYCSSRQAAAVHPLNKHANECLFYISVTFCPGESSYSLTPTPTVRPSGRATRTHVPVPHRDVTVRRLFLFFSWGERNGVGGPPCISNPRGRRARMPYSYPSMGL